MQSSTEQTDTYHARDFLKYIDRLENTFATEDTLDWLSVEPNEPILDIGCREGRFLRSITMRGGTVIGLDIDGSACKIAKTSSGSEVFQASAEFLPFRDSTFSRALLSHVIEHLSDPDTACSEARRVLQDAGKMVLSYPNSKYFLYLFGIGQDKAHKQELDSRHSWRGFVLQRKRVYLSLPAINDRIPLLSRIPILREVFYNVVLLLEKGYACWNCGRTVRARQGIIEKHKETWLYDCCASGLPPRRQKVDIEGETLFGVRRVMTS